MNDDDDDDGGLSFRVFSVDTKFLHAVLDRLGDRRYRSDPVGK